MVEFDNDETGNKYIILRPNSSLSAQQALMFFSGICAVTILIAVLLATMGLWLVLPFSGLELAVLGYCLLLVRKKSAEQEVITISEKKLLVQRGTLEVEQEEQLQMGWVQVNLERPKYKGHPSNLKIRSHGKSIEVGRFLVESERKKLALQLKKWL